MDYSMQTRTERQVGDLLLNAFEELDRCFDLEPEIRSFRPEPGGASIDQVLENLHFSLRSVLPSLAENADLAIHRFQESATIPAAHTNLQQIEKSWDTGNLAWIPLEDLDLFDEGPVEDLQKKLAEQGEELQSILDSLPGGIGSLRRLSLPVAEVRALDLYQWLYLTGLHVRAELARIADLRQSHEESTPAEGDPA